MKFQHALRDPIHGQIRMTACEWELLRTRAFSRMRGIRQMGMAYVVFPGAHHTRFEHMIGTMNAAWLLVEGLPFSDADKRLIRLAALCHDLGHRPFSHSLEDAARRHIHRPGLAFLGQFLDHEERTYECLRDDPEIGEVLSRHDAYRDMDRERLALVATGRHPEARLNLFTHSEIDADRIDYVLRDNYYCGFTSGVDVQALRDLYIPDADYGLVLNPQRLYVAMQILFARYHLIANIQNNPASRLGDLLLAECIGEALEDAGETTRDEFTRTVNEEQDTDLEHFLRAYAAPGWARLQALVSGPPPHQRIVTYDFPVLSPAIRYGIQSLRLDGQSVARKLQDRLAAETGTAPLIDVTRANPPTDPVPCAPTGHLPWHGQLTALPTVRGIIDASHDSGALHIYATAPLVVSDAQFNRWVDRYRVLDPSLDTHKAEGILTGLWQGDRTRMGLLLALESYTLDLLIEQVQRSPSRLDVLFLTCYLTWGVLEQLLEEPRVYIDGTESLWALVRHPAVVTGFGAKYPAQYAGPEPTGLFRNDVAYLQRCGLLYGATRLERLRSAFIERPKYGSTGWGRRLARLLAKPAGSAMLGQIDVQIWELLAPHVATYREYFNFLRAEDAAGSTRRRELRRQMPFAITR